MDKEKNPNVGIGLPVYNNERYLAATLESLLNQSYKNLVIYLCDDCSTDGTRKICETYQNKDPRIRYYQNSVNIGANENHKRALSLAETEYFMFARGHEILSQDLVRDCLRILIEDKNVVLSFATTKWIDSKGNIIPNKPIGFFDTRGFDVITRCALVLWGNLECFYGLTKTDTMKEIRALEEIIAGDVIMLIEMALRGSFAHIENSIRYRRYHYTGESYKKRMKRYRKSTYRKLKMIDNVFPLFRVPHNLFISVIKSGLKNSEKLKILLVILFSAPLRYMVSKNKKL